MEVFFICKKLCNYITSILNSPILVPSIEMIVVAFPIFCPSIDISILPSLISLILEISGRSVSFVESTVNENGKSQVYFCHSLSVMSMLIEAASPSLIGDLEVSFIFRSFCVKKCSAISLSFSNLRVRSLLMDVCGVVGVVGVGVVGVGVVVVGVVGVGVVGVGVVVVEVVVVSTPVVMIVVGGVSVSSTFLLL